MTLFFLFVNQFFKLRIAGMVQVSLTLLLYTSRNFCAKFTEPLNFTSVGAKFNQKKNFMLKLKCKANFMDF